MDSAGTAKARVLIVDGDEAARSALEGLLLQDGYAVTAVADGEQMFAHLSLQAVDLILLEVSLAGRDGFELCRLLCSDESMPPVIFVSARDQEVDRVVGLEMGADDYIVKPFSPRELLARVKAVLRRARRSARSGKLGLYHFADWVFRPAQMVLDLFTSLDRYARKAGVPAG